MAGPMPFPLFMAQPLKKNFFNGYKIPFCGFPKGCLHKVENVRTWKWSLESSKLSVIFPLKEGLKKNSTFWGHVRYHVGIKKNRFSSDKM